MVNKDKTSKNNITKLYIIFLFIACAIFLKTLIYQVREKHKLNLQIEMLEENKNKLNDEIESIKSDLKDVESEDFVKKVAREKLKMVEKNEVILKYKN